MEQNKQNFSGSYERAKTIFEKYNKDGYKGINSVGISFEIAALVKGIAILTNAEEKLR
ncbi:hypothetical protein QT327_18980 [Olivibacter sp. 47]|uniref:hypothetical protein n=1 Tax=Olivibacter sp. 47 TaxID=3056486 RepID=UPI0025A3DE8B|nr:hypothetical protein [Olivibacter sp. 47]MDM8176400.1 hypothetical protein [Olivibacter sp. 47]